MIYMIGGAPRTGKSQLAQKLIEICPMPYLSLDFLYNLSQIRELENFGNASILEKGRLFYPTLKDLLVELDVRAENCVIEGEVILPECIPELSKKYSIRSCFIGMSATSLEDIVSHADYFNWPRWKIENDRAHEVVDLAKRTVERSYTIEAETKRYDQMYFDLNGDYDRLSTRALDYLISGK